MQSVSLNIELHANQQRIHDSPALYKVAKCGKRFGKTKWAIYALLQAAGRKIGTYWMIAPTYRQAKSIAWREFKELLPHSLIKRSVENELLITLVNGSTLQLIGADNPDSLRGPKLDGVVFDEAAYVNKYIWNNIIRGQLLGSKGEKPGFAYFISSPNKDGVNWFTEFHQEAERKKQLGNPDWDAFYFTIYDNPTLDRTQIDDLKNDSTDDEWQVEYMAQESAHAGQIYTEFNYNQHVMECKPQGVLVRGHDWGIDHPTVCLFVYVDDESKRIYIEDEYVQSGFLIDESCDIVNKKTGSRPVDWDVCDPSMAKRNSQTGRTDKQEFEKCLKRSLIAGDNNKRGYNVTKMFFKKDIIRIHPRCRNLIKELKTLQWADKTNDDACDVLRYACVRIHDFMFNWKDAVADDGKPDYKYTPEYLKERRECSTNNKWMFPDAKPEAMSWLQEEYSTEVG